MRIIACSFTVTGNLKVQGIRIEGSGDGLPKYVDNDLNVWGADAVQDVADTGTLDVTPKFS